MKYLFIRFSGYLSLFFLVMSLSLYISCNSSDSGSGPDDTAQNAVKKIASNESGEISTQSGIKIQVIQGAVPQNSTGSNASVTFSIEAPVTPPAPVTNAEVKSNIIKLGPDGFNFRWPVKIVIPFKNASADEVKLIYYDALQSKWRAMPASRIDASTNTLEADVINLGYFAVAKLSSNFYKESAADSDGGFEFGGEPGYYYTLTVKSVSNFKYSYQSSYGAGLVGTTVGTGSYPTGGPKPPTRFILPQATYEIWVTRTQPGTLSTLPKIYTYTIPATGTISGPVSYTGPLSDGSGWTSLSMPGGGSWIEGAPGQWPAPTVTYGTGDFQATLTWVNSTSTDAADVDLHLFGPNNMHVYWSKKQSSDGSVELDRDWRRTTGNAVENIYSLASMPKGQYTIKVNLYSVGSTGLSKAYSVRVIRFLNVKTYTGVVSTVNTDDNAQDKMASIETFVIQ